MMEIIETTKADPSIALPNMLFLSGGRDKLVPPQHMRALYEMAAGAGSEAKIVIDVIPNGDHVDTCIQAEYFPAIQRFISSI